MAKRILYTAVSVALAVIIGVQTSVIAFAESTPVYLKELEIAVDADAETAKRKLKDKDFTVIEQNLKDGSGGKYVYMGYKTTKNKEEAISDVRLANMNSGIENLNYGELARRWQTNIDEVATDLMLAYSEIRANYNAGSPLAISAVEMLNIFDVDGVKLGEYLMSPERTIDDFEDLVLICSSDMVNVIYYGMFSAVADYNTDGSNFATRLSSVNKNEFTLERLKNNSLYACYDDDAVAMLEPLQNFAADYEMALDELKFYDEDQSDGEAEEASDEEQVEFWEKYLSEDFENSEDEDEQNAYYYATIICAYKTLEAYPSFSDDYENLGEYILACGEIFSQNNQNDFDVHRFRVYPLVASLTPGQRATLKMAGLTTLISTLSGNNSDNRKKIENAIVAIKNELAENDLTSVSVFYNVNRDIYSQNVGLTADTARVARANDEYFELTKEKEDDKLIATCTQIMRIAGAAVCITLAASIFIAIGISLIAGVSIISAFSIGYTAILAGSMAAAAAMFEVTTGAVVASIVGVTMVAVALVVLAVIVICVIIAILKKILSEEDEPEVVYTQIPDIMFDLSNKKYVQYEAVQNTDGAPCDINDNNGNQWDAVYYTKSTAVGSPIRVNDGYPFLIQINSMLTPQGYVPLKRFGYKTAADFNAFDKGSKTISFFYKTDDSINGVVDLKENDGKYLYDIEVHTEDTEEACLAYFQKQEEFSCIEKNIAPTSGKCTYIGYQTTNDPDDAITDIRAVFNYSSNSIRYGVDGLGKFVEYSNSGTAANNVSIFYTKNANNGTPVYSDIFITADKKGNPAPSGWEPVNMFSGGEAFDFGLTCGNQTISKSLYIYFHPSVMFTAENSKEYISGFCFVNGDDKVNSRCDGGFDYLQNYGEHFGFELIDGVGEYNLTKDATFYDTYIMMSTTYNPYRAISDVATYTASCSADAVSKSISVGATAYTACETFYQHKEWGLFTDDMYLLIRTSNGYVTKHDQEGAVTVPLSGNSDWQVQNEEGNSDNIRVKGFYVAGPVNRGSTALTPSDIHFDFSYAYYRDVSGDTITPYRQVHDITEPYSAAADNLTFEYEQAEEYFSGGMSSVGVFIPQYRDFDNHLYMSIKGTPEDRGKYVGGIYAAYSNSEKGYSDDEAILKLLSLGKGEIIRTNLAEKASNQSYTYDSSTGKYTYNNRNGKTSYVIVTYTDTLSKSLRCTLTSWYASETASQDRSIKAKGTTFNKGGEIIKSLTGYYSLYNSANTQLGQPVTSVKIDTEPYTDFSTTVIGADGNGHTGEEYFIKLVHSESNLSNSYVNKFVYVTGNSRLDCAKQLLAKGCSVFIDRNKNEGLKGYTYFGYDTTSDAKDGNIITDIVTKSSDSDNLPDSYEENGAKYTKLSSNMNSGVGGKYTYIYVTHSDKFKPVTAIDITQHMARALKYYSYLFTQTWYKNTNLADGTGKSCILCFKRTSEWSLTNNELDIFYNGSMPGFKKNYSFFYVNEYGGTKKTVNFYPEWTEYADKITTATIEKNVTNINALAFYNCTALKSVNVLNDDISIASGAIPDGVTLYAHYGSKTYETAKSMGIKCDYLSRGSGSCGVGAKYKDYADSIIVYGTGEVTSAPWGDVNGVTEIVIQNGITKICASTFKDTVIKNIRLEAKDCIIEDGAIPKDVTIRCFKGSTAYEYAIANGNEYVVLPDASGKSDNSTWNLYDDTLEIESTEAVLRHDSEWDSFSHRVKTVEISGNASQLGDNCFADFKNLQTVTSEATITSVGKNAFLNCISLEDKLLSSDALTSIGDYAYANCTKLDFIKLSNNVQSVGSNAFFNGGQPSKELHVIVTNKACTVGENVISSNGILHTYKDSASAGYKATNGARAYAYRDMDLSQSAGKNVYWGITDDGTFNLFGYDAAATDYTGKFSEIPKDTLTFYPWGKYVQKDIKKLNVFDGIKEIPRMGFQGATNMTELNIGKDVTIVKDYSCYDTAIENIVLPSNVTAVYDCAFVSYSLRAQRMTVLNSRCMLYYQLTLPKATTVYGYAGSTAKIYAAKLGAKFVAITSASAIPAQISKTTEVKEETTVSEKTTSAVETTTENEIKADEMSWELDNGELKISGKCKMTDYSADVLAPWSAEADKITSITVSDGVTSIGDYAFEGLTKVTEVNISASVTSVGDYAFGNNKALKTVAIPNKVERLGEGAFNGCDALESITVESSTCDISRAGVSGVSKIVSPENSLAYQYAVENNIEAESISQNLIGTSVSQLGSTKMIIALLLLLCFIAAGAVIYKKKKRGQ